MGYFGAFQNRVADWTEACFGEKISADLEERNHRFLEESLELVQARGCARDAAHQLVDYVYERPIGEPEQEVGGVAVTLAALCSASGLCLEEAAERELSRVWSKVEAIRAKQAAKPKFSALPGKADALADVAAEPRRQVEVEGWSAKHDDMYQFGELGAAALNYLAASLMPEQAGYVGISPPFNDRPTDDPAFRWPWELCWWRPATTRRMLVKAGALILAEIERLDRAEARNAKPLAEAA